MIDLPVYSATSKPLMAWRLGEKFGRELSTEQEETSCQQNCCCECQSNLDWLKLPIWLIALALIVIAIALLVNALAQMGDVLVKVVGLALRHPFWTLIAIFVAIRLVG